MLINGTAYPISTLEVSESLLNIWTKNELGAPPIKAGRLRGIAQMGTRRSHLLPDLTTLNELGIRDAEIGGWYGLYAPAKTPRAIVDTLYQNVVKVLQNADTKERMSKLGAEPMLMTPAFSPGPCSTHGACVGSVLSTGRECL